MPNKNPNCGGAHCSAATGPVKLYPTGGGGNDILCHSCWEHQNAYNRQRVRDGAEAANFPVQDWATAKPFEEDSDEALEIRARAAAMAEWCDDGINIDTKAAVSIGEDGAWVQAWVFVSNELIGIGE